MSTYSLNKQGGVVLVFSLLFLLLITIAVVGQIQQNKNQLAIISNMGAQTKAFAKVESALSLIEAEVEAKRQPNKYNINTPAQNLYDCSSNIGNQLFEGDSILLANMPNVSASIKAVSCIVNSSESRCIDSPDSLISGSSLATTPCVKLRTAQCPTELYTIETSFIDPDSSAKRTIRFKYSVGCSVNKD